MLLLETCCHGKGRFLLRRLHYIMCGSRNICRAPKAFVFKSSLISLLKPLRLVLLNKKRNVYAAVADIADTVGRDLVQ